LEVDLLLLRRRRGAEAEADGALGTDALRLLLERDRLRLVDGALGVAILRRRATRLPAERDRLADGDLDTARRRRLFLELDLRPLRLGALGTEAFRLRLREADLERLGALGVADLRLLWRLELLRRALRLAAFRLAERERLVDLDRLRDLDGFFAFRATRRSPELSARLFFLFASFRFAKNSAFSSQYCLYFLVFR